MIKDIREAFNSGYREGYYKALLDDVVRSFGEQAAFRIAETPVFIPRSMQQKIFDACDAILEQLGAMDLKAVRQAFVPQKLQSPNPLGDPQFLAIDFGICENADGELEPQLIELQAFPSLMFYQAFLGKAFMDNYPTVPGNGFHYFFGGLDEERYKDLARKLIVGDEDPENVVLLELYPERQRTRIDFWATRKALGIEPVSITEVRKQGQQIFYEKNGKTIPIHRIYNRVIWDELQSNPDLHLQFNLNDPVDATWVTHPDWFFIISKCLLPRLHNKYIPKAYYVNEMPQDLDLGQYVLKPLFSFAGHGIDLAPTRATIEKLPNKQDYILQRKVSYAPLIRTNTERNAKIEIRILYLWDEDVKRLRPVVNLTRMSKGAMINVSHQNNDTWVGSSISFFED